MMMANNSLWVQLKEQNPELLTEDKVGAFILANKVPAMLQGGTLVSRSASTKHAAAAQALVEFLGTPDSILPAAAQRGVVPGVPVRPHPVTTAYAVIRAGGIHAILDHGPHGGSHGHHDKLALYLYGATTPWQPDPGHVPYGHAQWRRHYKSVTAHPAIRIDGLEPEEATGVLTQDATSVTAEVVGWYEGVRATRQVITGDGYLVERVPGDGGSGAGDRAAVPARCRPDRRGRTHTGSHDVGRRRNAVRLSRRSGGAGDSPGTRSGRRPAADPDRDGLDGRRYHRDLLLRLLDHGGGRRGDR